MTNAEARKGLTRLITSLGLNRKQPDESWPDYLKPRIIGWCRFHPSLERFLREATSYLPRDSSLIERWGYIRYGFDGPNLCECGTLIRWSWNKFPKYCSRACGWKSEGRFKRAEETMRERYGDATYQVTKMRETVKRKYGVDNISQLESTQEKIRRTSRRKYGTDHHAQAESIKKKARRTNLKRYGAANYMQTAEGKNKSLEGMVAKYGDHVMRVEKFKVKQNKSLIDKYGGVGAFASPELRAKAEATMEHRYGTSIPMRSQKLRERVRQTCLGKYGVDNPMKSEAVVAKSSYRQKRAFYDSLTDSNRLGKYIEPQFDLDTYLENKPTETKFLFHCKKCDTEFYSRLWNGLLPRCPTCYPNFRSRAEEEIGIFLSKYTEVVRNDREQLGGLELDIYLPEYRIAVEHNGLYYHSSRTSGKGRTYHQDKMKLCQDKGIRLFSIFSDDWIHKQPLIKSMLKYALGRSKPVYARKCSVVTDFDAKDFFTQNHLQGYCRGKKFGLEYEGQIVAAMIVSSSRFDAQYDWEIIRFASLLGTSVVGGFSKLLSAFRKCYSGSILSYADASHSQGHVYESNGFRKVGLTQPGFFYVERGHNTRVPRQAFQKHKLKDVLTDYDPQLSASENLQLHGYDKIYDCGHWKYVLD